jgi:hypothetical protein
MIASVSEVLSTSVALQGIIDIEVVGASLG